MAKSLFNLGNSPELLEAMKFITLNAHRTDENAEQYDRHIKTLVEAMERAGMDRKTRRREVDG